MKKIIIISLCIFLSLISVKASLPLQGKYIFIDVGHGFLDPGTSYGNLLEKDLNLSISLALERELTLNGASVTLDRYGDYDLSTPHAKHRKKSDFDNRIDLINNSHADIYLSIHINYLEDTSYSGGQIFYYGDDNKPLADDIQMYFNTISTPRSTKPMPNIYMYKYLKIPGVLIECGFISNYQERMNLQDSVYQEKIATVITKGIITYFT